MIRLLEGFTGNALGVAYVGHVTADDYKTVLEPEIENRIARYGDVRLLVRFGAEFEAFSPSAMWSDTKLGLSYWSDFARIAVVSDVTWLRDTVLMMKPFFGHPVKLFGDADFDTARAWLLEGGAS